MSGAAVHGWILSCGGQVTWKKDLPRPGYAGEGQILGLPDDQALEGFRVGLEGRQVSFLAREAASATTIRVPSGALRTLNS